MEKHNGKRLCITGIPTSGKSTLTKRLAEDTDGVPVLLDDFRETLVSDDRYRKWVNFYLDQDQETYYTTVSPEKQWQNLVAQSEALWPGFFAKIHSYVNETRPVIFECVNLLPHLVHRNLGFPCIVLIGKSYGEVYERNTHEPRWGDKPNELELSAYSFYHIERPHYEKEGREYGYSVFEDSDAAYSTALDFLW